MNQFFGRSFSKNAGLGVTSKKNKQKSSLEQIIQDEIDQNLLTILLNVWLNVMINGTTLGAEL